MDLKKLPKTEFAAAVAQIAGERNIDVQSILDSIEMGLISAYKRDQKEHGIIVSEEDEFTAELTPENGSFKVYKIDVKILSCFLLDLGLLLRRVLFNCSSCCRVQSIII